MVDFIFLPSDCARKEICTFNIIIHFVISSSTFKSRRTNKSYTIFHEVNCSSTYVICPMECTLCKKQYVRKSETSFNIRLNNHHKDVKNLMPCQLADTSKKNHVFNKHVKFIIINKLTNTTKSKDILRQRLIERENFQIQTLETLHPKRLNQELSTKQKDCSAAS